jgi:glycosyltransferase involved in cell wall biosynthesis
MGDQQGGLNSGPPTSPDLSAPGGGGEGKGLKIIEVTNVDFSLRHFLLPLMRGLRARGHEVIGACAEGRLLDDVRAEGFRVVGVPFARKLSPLAHVRAFFWLVRLFRTERPDLVHAHMPISGFLTRLAARAAGVPRVAYTCHGFLFNQEGSWLRRFGGLAMEWCGGWITDVFMTVSAAEARDARRLHIHRGAVAVGNGRDPARYRPDAEVRQRIRAALGVTDQQVVVLAVSRLVWPKGYPELAEAMRALPDVALWVVGERLESDRGPDMVALLLGAGLGERLRLLGYRDDVPELMAAADIFALPSRFEAMPMSVIEAMLSGLPVVAGNVGGATEEVVAEETGLLITPGDASVLASALGRLAGDAALRARMGAAGRRRAVECFDEAKVLARTLELLGA